MEWTQQLIKVAASLLTEGYMRRVIGSVKKKQEYVATSSKVKVVLIMVETYVFSSTLKNEIVSSTAKFLWS